METSRCKAGTTSRKETMLEADIDFDTYISRSSTIQAGPISEPMAWTDPLLGLSEASNNTFNTFITQQDVARDFDLEMNPEHDLGRRFDLASGDEDQIWFEDDHNPQSEAEKQAPETKPDMNNSEVLTLYTELLLFSKNESSDPSLRFRDCSLARKNILKPLASNLGLLLSHSNNFKDVIVSKQSDLLFQDPPTKVHGLTLDAQLSQAPLVDFLQTETNIASPRNSFNFQPDRGNVSMDPSTLDLNYGVAEDQLQKDHVAEANVSVGNGSSRNRSPLMSALSAEIVTLREVGACWRCKILRKKCDLENPCKACPKPDLRSLWQVVGCRRGTIIEQVRPILLCSNANVDSVPAGISLAEQRACERRLKMAKVVLDIANERLLIVSTKQENTIQKTILEYCCPAVKLLDPSNHSLEQNDSGTAILCIVWGLVDCPTVKSVLDTSSVEVVSGLLKAATNFESEYADTGLISVSIASLRYCVDALRIYAEGFLMTFPHTTCSREKCRLGCLHNLRATINAYLEEFSRVILRRENLQNERSWWLHCFYSLCIQAYVRRCLIFIEKKLSPQPSSSSIRMTAAENSPAFGYLQLAIRLFTAAAAGFDPLASTWILEEPPEALSSDLGLLKDYRHAQRALQSTHWAFHDSVLQPGMADVCGYCGEEFPRSEPGMDLSGDSQASLEDWDERFRHLLEVHKFKECNTGKKFFRADHFRQHLKHSHAGTSGKWTNMLENACMEEAEPAIP
ncbi:Fc.00g003900.m01.CDS01 [Cosmosporella sp. VM-42]